MGKKGWGLHRWLLDGSKTQQTKNALAVRIVCSGNLLCTHLLCTPLKNSFSTYILPTNWEATFKILVLSARCIFVLMF
jgi:hypothetical protein